MTYYERINDFRINLGARKKLGQGSQGTVYPGISLITKDPVAAKRTEGVYKEYFNKDEFEKEADLLLNRIPPHENIIKVFDFTKTEYEDKGIPLLDLWLITELCEFGNLKEFAYSRDLSIEQKIELMYQSALAVRHLHACKPESIAHRDVKPENILLTGNEDSPTVKLCDFGSAKSLARKDGKSMSMRSVAGTRRYQAPEQVETLEGNSKYDKQVDIFSLGITYLALLKARKGTLLTPETINEKGLGEIMWIKHKCHDNLPFSIHNSSDSSLVRAVKAVIENMIKFEPSSRLSAAEVVEELSKVRKGHLIPTPQPTRPADLQPVPPAVPQPTPVTDLHPLPSTDPQPGHTAVPQSTPATFPSPTPTTVLQPAPATLPRTAPATLLQTAPATLPRNFFKAPATVPRPTPATVPQPAPASGNLLPGTKVVALSSFTGKSEDHLSFERHDALTITESMSNTGWYKARDQTGKIGLIPSRFVQRRGIQLQPMKWQHEKMTRKQAHALLLGEEISESMASLETCKRCSDKDVGTFFVHSVSDNESLCPGHVYTLCVVAPDKAVEGYLILQKDTKLTIDEDKFFENLQQLVQVYEKDANGLCTELRRPLVNESDVRLRVDSGDFLREGWTISESEIHTLDKCYVGAFTDTYKGEYLGRDVFIMKRKDPHSVQDARIEAAVMTGLSHKNLVQLIGVVLGDETLIVTEFLSKGRLCDCLLSQGPDGITSQDQMSFARDVCSGMQYLEQNEIVQRKLMAQSVLLSKDGTAKVGEFTFAHPIGQHKGPSKFKPRWTAPEIPARNIFTSKSDMWSFGVLLWEIYSFGSKPYPGILDKDFHSFVMDGGRMEAPDGCPDEIYHVMLAAWDIDPDQRPTFSDTCKFLDKVEVDMYMTCL